MTTRGWQIIAGILFLTVLVLAWFLLVRKAEAPVQEEGETIQVATSSLPSEGLAPLHERVYVSSPTPHSAVGETFVVKGEAPGPWFFEASFPIQVRDGEGSVIARTHANARGEWMTTEQVQFESTVHVGAYRGAAVLVLMRDNPSGLPEHDDALEIPIVVQ